MFHSFSMRRRDSKEKILDVAVSLAEKGGFDRVRQREVAAEAGVALGTLYKRFRSKEDLLCAALKRDSEMLVRRMERAPARGDTAHERLCNFLQLVTRALLKKPNYARAVIRAMSSGVPEIAANVAAYQGLMNGLIIGALRGGARPGGADDAAPPTRKEARLALLLQQIWFATLVGWSAGLYTQNETLEQMRQTTKVILRGMEAEV